MKKTFLLILCFLSFVVVTSCTNSINVFRKSDMNLNSDYYGQLTEEEIKSKGHKSLIPEYSTVNTTGYKNKNGTKTLYVYACPIRFIDNNDQLSLIDTSLINIEDDTLIGKGYSYTVSNSDIKSFFPAELSKDRAIKLQKNMEYEFSTDNDGVIKSQIIDQLNFIGEKRAMITYKNAFGENSSLNFYPSLLGVNSEIVFNEKPTSNLVKFRLKAVDCNITVDPAGYIMMKKEMVNDKGNSNMEIVGIIQAPLIRDDNGKLCYNNKHRINKIDNDYYELTASLDNEFLNDPGIQYPLTCYIPFEMRREKQPDSAVYSKKPNLNSFLSNYHILGNSDDFGQGQIRIRYDFASKFDLKANEIISAQYTIFNLSNNNVQDNLEMVSILEDWCSTAGTWSVPVELGELVTSLQMKSPQMEFDITDEVKKWCDSRDGMEEIFGLQLKSVDEEKGVWNVVSSNDCALFNNRTEVTLK